MENQINEIIFGDGADGSIRSELLRAIPPGKIFTDLLEDTKRLQQKLTRQHMSFATAHMVENTASPRDAARLRSLGGKEHDSRISSIFTTVLTSILATYAVCVALQTNNRQILLDLL